MKYTAYLLLALSACFPLGAETLSNNLARTSAGTERASSSTWLAVSFATSSTALRLESATLLLANPSAAQATLYLYTDGGLKPGVSLGAFSSPAEYSASAAQTVFPAAFSVLPNTTYW